MRRKIFCLICLGIIVLFSSDSVLAAQRIYDFKSAIVDIQIAGPNNNGKETVYIDDWGNTEARYTETTVSVFGMKKTTKQMTLRKGDILYTVDDKANTATKVNINETMKEFQGTSQGKNWRAINDEVVKNMRGRKIGKEKISGKQADVILFEDLGTKTWVWKRFPVKSETKMAGVKIITEATRIQENVPIPKDKISLRKNIKIVDAPDVSGVFEKLNAYKQPPPDDQYMDDQEMREMPDEMDAGNPGLEDAMKMMQDLF